MVSEPESSAELTQEFGPEIAQKFGTELAQGFSRDEQDEPFGPLTQLIGLFSNSQGIHAVKLPGINAIALPDGTPQHEPLGIAFKANTYNEVNLNFRPIGGPVRNRAVSAFQTVHALAYQQVISQLEGPLPSGIQHVEDGLWMWAPEPTPVADLPPGTDLTNLPPASMEGPIVARSASVPHGNSFLCWGRFNPTMHVTMGQPPHIPDTDFTPQVTNPPSDLENFINTNYNSPIIPGMPEVTPAHINRALIDVVQAQLDAGYKFKKVITLIVNTNNPTVPPPPHPGGVSNIDFILKNANFTGISTTFWIETVQPPDSQEPPFVQLQYSQNTSLTFAPQNDPEFKVTFPHPDANTLLRQDRVAF